MHVNPEYVPWMGMLNEKTKDEMYDLHIKDPKFWTVRKLANEYDTEMERVEAILVLKKMEKDMIAQVHMPITIIMNNPLLDGLLSFLGFAGLHLFHSFFHV